MRICAGVRVALLGWLFVSTTSHINKMTHEKSNNKKPCAHPRKIRGQKIISILLISSSSPEAASKNDELKVNYTNIVFTTAQTKAAFIYVCRPFINIYT
jgi:hypothetical protein